ncbi:outer membrane lipoprotein-sorting protein [Flagellimonas nanhaiensis]|uniref:Outer membrane lipoprotein-sorting protein n=1 Tax=Flagellimonas nanhaiensis TaxID=2292706 RepID=A0A371JNN3_9FLAO|nr:outer membrane lipoprotein-sorting protein [Allomuricauda nanhaiensis]RDY58780.1 outer membrane lipoprotein-sorting protein [Allomuricauda nanhaiensis]
MRKSKFLIAIFSAFFTVAVGFSQSAEERGLQIAKAAEKADEGFGSSIVELKMTLKNKNGQTSERFLTTQTLELTEDGDKSLIVFESPKDVKGTATLTFTHKVGADDQWLYLPSIKRVKRISSNNKSGPFVGSEFAYEDLSSQEVEKYAYKFLKAEGELLLVEQDPVDPKSGYTRRVVTYNKDKGYRLEKVEFYDRKNALLKTLTYSDYKLYKNKFWRALTFNMVNHQSNKETLLNFGEYNFGAELAEEDFTEVALKRVGR